jgi:hypothetical protein
MDELFNEHDVFNKEIDFSSAVPYISSYYKSKLSLEETKQKGFILAAMGDFDPLAIVRFWVFPSFIISCRTYPNTRPEVDIEQHSLSIYALGKMKLHKVHSCDSISGILSRFEKLDSNRLKYSKPISYVKRDNLLEQTLRLENDNLLLKEEHCKIQKHNNLLDIEKQKLLFEIKDCKAAFESERKAFEKEKLELEQELAKYKGIVMNCQKEIQAYGL